LALSQKEVEFHFIYLSACNIPRQTRRIFMKVDNRGFYIYFRFQILVQTEQKQKLCKNTVSNFPHNSVTEIFGTEIVDITDVRVYPT
jgi:hypothetical protein